MDRIQHFAKRKSYKRLRSRLGREEHTLLNLVSKTYQSYPCNFFSINFLFVYNALNRKPRLAFSLMFATL